MEQLKKNRFLVAGLIALLLLSSCGTFTKMRYSRGFKADFSFNRKPKEAEAPILHANKAHKKKHESTSTIHNNNNSDSIYEVSKLSNISENIQPLATKQSYNVKKQNTDVAKHEKKTFTQKKTEENIPIEPNVATGGIFYLLGYFFIGISGFASISTLSVILPFVGLLLLLIGFILAIIGLRKINRAPDQFRGEAIAIIIIVLFLLSILLSFFTLLVLYVLLL
ncbi:MAG: hypothetical protein V4613_11545 [Bacteroidota bacterium]